MFAASDIDQVSRILRTEAAEVATLPEVERIAATHTISKIADDLAQVISLSSRISFDRDMFHRVSGLTRDEQGTWSIEPARQVHAHDVMSGGRLHCSDCGSGLFYYMTRCRDYQTLKCCECGTLRQTLTETGASS